MAGLLQTGRCSMGRIALVRPLFRRSPQRARTLATLGGAQPPPQRVQLAHDMTATAEVLGLKLRLITPDCALYTATAADMAQVCGSRCN